MWIVNICELRIVCRLWIENWELSITESCELRIIVNCELWIERIENCDWELRIVNNWELRIESNCELWMGNCELRIQFTIHNPQFTIHNSQLSVIHNPQFTILSILNYLQFTIPESSRIRSSAYPPVHLSAWSYYISIFVLARSWTTFKKCCLQTFWLQMAFSKSVYSLCTHHSSRMTYNLFHHMQVGLPMSHHQFFRSLLLLYYLEFVIFHTRPSNNFERFWRVSSGVGKEGCRK